MTLPPAPGLRERKKERTRQAIADAARVLFQRRGFEEVTVAEIAAAADVSEGTVFNYFPTKEDLFYSGMEVFEARLVDAVRERAAGESVLDAFRRVVVEGTARLADVDAAEMIAQAATMVRASPALQAREREVVARYTAELARLIAEEAGGHNGDAAPAAAAGALMAAQRALVAYVHERVLAGDRGRRLTTSTRAQAREAFALLESGLSGYGVKSGSR